MLDLDQFADTKVLCTKHSIITQMLVTSLVMSLAWQGICKIGSSGEVIQVKMDSGFEGNQMAWDDLTGHFCHWVRVV